MIIFYIFYLARNKTWKINKYTSSSLISNLKKKFYFISRYTSFLYLLENDFFLSFHMTIINKSQVKYTSIKDVKLLIIILYKLQIKSKIGFRVNLESKPTNSDTFSKLLISFTLPTTTTAVNTARYNNIAYQILFRKRALNRCP